MSNDQPGPYGQQPPSGPPAGGPGPHGAPQPPGGPSPYAPAPGAPAGGSFGPPSGGRYGQPGGFGQPGQPAQQGPGGQVPGGAAYPPPGPGAQQGPAAPYGAPPAQPPAGQQPEQPGPGQGGGSRRGLVIGAAVVVLAAVAAGAFFLFGDGDEDGDQDSAGGPAVGEGGSYTLVLPETSGDFALVNPAESTTDLDPEALGRLGLSEANATRGSYVSGLSPEEANALSGPQDLGDRTLVEMEAEGLWGSVDDPSAALNAAFAFAADELSQGQDQVTLQGEPQDVRPEGLPEDAVMKCQMGTVRVQGSEVSVPVCAWADHSTMGLTYSLGVNAQGPFAVDLEDAAAATARLRADSLQEAGS